MPSRLEVQQLLINNEFWKLVNQQIYESFDRDRKSVV